MFKNFGSDREKRTVNVLTQEQFDDSAKALFEWITGEPVPEDFISIEYDRFWAMSRVALEGAGLEVP